MRNEGGGLLAAKEGRIIPKYTQTCQNGIYEYIAELASNKGCAVAWDISDNMANHIVNRQKRSLSLHQKQIRFFIGLSVATSVLLAISIFLLLNWSSIASR